MHGVLAGEVVSAAGGLDGVNVADQVGNGDVWRCQLFDIAVFRGQVIDEGLIFLFRDHLDAACADGSVGIVVDFASGDAGQVLVEQPELLDRDAARIGVRAETLMADADADRFLRRPGRGDEHERGHEADGRGARSWLDHSLFFSRILSASLTGTGRTLPSPSARRGWRPQSETGPRQSMSRAVEFL